MTAIQPFVDLLFMGAAGFWPDITAEQFQESKERCLQGRDGEHITVRDLSVAMYDDLVAHLGRPTKKGNV